VPTKDRLTREEFQSRPTKNETSFLKAAAANAATTVVAPKHRRCASMRLSKQVAAKGLFHEYALECREGQRDIAATEAAVLTRLSPPTLP
jgi:hypothetical protein